MFYGIQNVKTGNLMGNPYVWSNGEDTDVCNSCSVEINECIHDTDIPWMTWRREYAQDVIEGVEWYNSSLETPQLNGNAKDFKIVEIELGVK